MILNKSARLLLAFLAAGSFLCSADHASAWAEKQVGSVEIINLKVGRYRRLADSAWKTVDRGFIEYITAPQGYSFVVIWMDLKLTPGEGTKGDLRVEVPSNLITVDGGRGKKLDCIGICPQNGCMQSGYNSTSYSYFGVPENATVPNSLVVVVPDDLAKFKFTFGNETKEVSVPSEAEDTIDRAACATFKIAKVEVVDKLERKRRLGRYNDPIGDAIISAKGPASRFVIVHLHMKGNVATHHDGGVSVPTDFLGALYGGIVHSMSMGYINDDDEFVAESSSMNSPQDVEGHFFTDSVRLVFPLPGKLKEFKLLYLMQPIADIKVPE